MQKYGESVLASVASQRGLQVGTSKVYFGGQWLVQYN